MFVKYLKSMLHPNAGVLMNKNSIVEVDDGQGKFFIAMGDAEKAAGGAKETPIPEVLPRAGMEVSTEAVATIMHAIAGMNQTDVKKAELQKAAQAKIDAAKKAAEEAKKAAEEAKKAHA